MSRGNDTETHEFENCTAKRDSGKALLVNIPDLDDDVWIPKSQIHDDSEVWGAGEDEKGPGTLVVTMWLAREKGWV